MLKAANSQVILRSQQYMSKGAARTGIASVQKESPSDGQYVLETASDGRFYFNLKVDNHQIVGTSQMYETQASRGTGIESVKTHGPSTDVRDA